MEFNKEEARRAIEIAERKISEKDYYEAKRFVNKARCLYPKLDGLEQVLMIIDVYICASYGSGEAVWCAILGVDPKADDETIKKQYKKLALYLHPDKNKFNGAEGAFKLVSEACSLLTDKVKRSSNVQKKTDDMHHKPPNPQKPAASTRRTKQSTTTGKTFWTVCNNCKTRCEYLREKYLNKAITCPNCRQGFIATEKTTQATNKTTKGASAPSVSATRKTPKQQQQQQRSAQNTSGGGTKRYSSSPVKFQLNCAVSARSYNGIAAEKILKKPRTM